MSMDLFRRNQKVIFIIVAIIIIPSFALVWTGVDMFSGSSQQEFTLATVNGKPFKASEFEAFQKRIQAALGGIPLEFANAPGKGTPYEELYKYVFTYALLQDAVAAKANVSELQLGTYLENGHPIISAGYDRNDRQSLERAVDAFCRQRQISRPELLRGIREWQIIGNYLDADSNLSAVNDETVFAFYALNKAEVVVKRVRVAETESTKEQAKKDVMEKPAEDLERDVRAYIASKAEDRKYREPARWRFAYVFTPFVAGDSVRQPSESEIQQQYDAGKAYLYNNEPLEAVQDRIRADLLTREIERQTLRNVNIDIDPQLRGKAADNLDEMVKLAQLVKYGVSAGDSGSEALSAGDLAKTLPAGMDLQLRIFLEELDKMSPAEVDTLKDDFMLAFPPFKATDGFVRMRLLEYVPSTPRAIDGDDGAVVPELFEMAVADMVGDRAEELTRELAEDVERRLRAHMEAKEKGEDAPDAELAVEFEALPAETVTYVELGDRNYELGRLVIGDMLGPIELGGAGDFALELVVVTDRRVPSRETFEAEPAEIKARYRNIAMTNYRGSYGFTYTENGPVAMIQASPSVMGGLADRFNKGEIRMNPELLRDPTEG